MESNIPEGQKRELLFRELSTIGVGLDEPITLDNLDQILRQKSV